MLDLIQHPTLTSLGPIFKIGFLILLGLYIVFAFMLLSKIRSFDRIVTFDARSGIIFVRVFAYTFLTLLVFLFIISLVIV